MNKTVSVLFDLPASLQLDILSSWLNFPGDSKKAEKNLMVLEQAVCNKTMRDNLRDVYGSLDWEGYFCSEHYLSEPRVRAKWLFVRRICFKTLVLTQCHSVGAMYGLVDDFAHLIALSGKTVKVIKILNTNTSLSCVMEYITKYCKVLETLCLDGCNIIQALATVLKRCPTITDLRVRKCYDKAGPVTHAAEVGELVAKKEKKSVFAQLVRRNVKKFALLHTINATEVATVTAAFPNVVELALKASHLTDIFTTAFGAWRKLESVSITRTCAGLVFAVWSKPESVPTPCSGVVINGAMCTALKHSASTLRKLDFQCHLHAIDLPAFDSLVVQCTHLNDISFTFNAGTPMDTIRTLITTCNKRLVHLNMYRIKHLPPDIVVLISKHCPNLRTLASRGLRACPNNALILQNCVHLEKLYIELSYLQDDSLEFLERIAAHCKDLRLLCLCYDFCGGAFDKPTIPILLSNPHLHTVAVESRDIFSRYQKRSINFINYVDCMKKDLGINIDDHLDDWVVHEDEFFEDF